MADYFKDSIMLPNYPVRVLRDLARSKSDVEISRASGMPYANASNIDIADKTVAIVCAAKSLLEPIAAGGSQRRIDMLNDHIGEYYVVVAGAGHFTLNDGSLKRADMAISNFSEGNSHTKAFTPARNDLVYVLASHGLSNEEAGNKPTLTHLKEQLADPERNTRLYDAVLGKDTPSPENGLLIGAGTGAPPAAVAFMAAMRKEKGLGPLEAKLFGFDATADFIMSTDTLPPAYAERLEKGDILVELDQKRYLVQQAFFNQMEQLVFMARFYPELIKKITVDNPDSLPGAVFNVDGLPRMDYKVVDLATPPTPAPIF